MITAHEQVRKKLCSEGGAVALVEASYLFPIAFLLVFLLVSLALLLFYGAWSDIHLLGEVQKSTNDPAYQAPKLEEKWRLGDLHAQVSGLFLRELAYDGQTQTEHPMAQRFFHLPQQGMLQKRGVGNWVSSTDNLWHFMAIEEGIRKMERRKTK